MKRVLWLLPLLFACTTLPAVGGEEGFQLLNAEELRLRLRDRNGTPFEGSFRVLTREAPVVAGRTYLSLRGLEAARDPYVDHDPWCVGTEVFVAWEGGLHLEGRGGLFREDGTQARLYLVPRALPYAYPAKEYWALAYTPTGLTRKGTGACGGRTVLYDLELLPGWNLVYAEPPTPRHGAWVYGRKEAPWGVEVW